MDFNFGLDSDALSPIYLAAVQKLQNDVNYAVNNTEKQIQYFKDFTEKYTTLPCIWKEWARIVVQHIPITVETRDERMQLSAEVYLKAQFHFFDPFVYKLPMSYDVFQNTHKWRKVMSWPFYLSNYLELTEQFDVQNLAEGSFFNFPHVFLQNNLEYYKQYSAKPVSKELYAKYQKSLKLYEEFKILWVDEKKWLNLLLTVKDDKFVVQNIEWKLSQSPENKKIWQFYLKFLNDEENYQWLLDVYLRYCRFFIDDTNMRQKYRMEIERIEKWKNFNVTKWKIDCIKFEKDFCSKECAIILMKKYFHCENIALESNFESFLKAVEDTTVNNSPEYPNYAIEEQLENLSRLYSTCKQFYASTKIPICHRFEIGNFKKPVVYQHSLFVSSDDEMEKLKNIKKLYLTNSLFAKNDLDAYAISEFSISKFIPKIFKSDIKYFSCKNQILTFEEFKFICGSVKHASFSYSSYIRDGERTVSFFEMVSFMSYIETIYFYKIKNNLPPLFPPNCNNQNFDKLKIVKIKRVDIYKLSELNDPELARNFLTNIAAPNSSFFLCFSGDENNRNILRNLLTNHSWIDENMKPYFSLL